MCHQPPIYLYPAASDPRLRIRKSSDGSEDLTFRLSTQHLESSNCKHSAVGSCRSEDMNLAPLNIKYTSLYFSQLCTINNLNMSLEEKKQLRAFYLSLYLLHITEALVSHKLSAGKTDVSKSCGSRCVLFVIRVSCSFGSEFNPFVV